jgi:hypothetical protein
VFKPRIMNSVHGFHRRDMTLSLATNVKDAVEVRRAEATKITPIYAVVNPRTTTPNSKN